MDDRSGGGTLIIVRADDCAADHFLLREAVRRSSLAERIELQFVSGGEALLERVQSGAPVDLILLDLDMPDLNGHQVLDRLHTSSGDTSPPVVVFTHSPRRQDRDISMAKGAVRHMVKPTRFNELVEMVESLPIPAARPWHPGRATGVEAEPGPKFRFLVTGKNRH